MNETSQSPVFALADEYVAQVAALDPLAATQLGVAGYDHLMPDFSTSGAEAMAALAESTLALLTTLESASEFAVDDRIAALSMRERLGSLLDMHAAGDHVRSLNVLACPAQEVRAVFDLMPAATPEQRENVRLRMLAVPAALASWRSSLAEGLATGLVAARRQALAVADQCDTFGSASDGWFSARARTIADESGDELEPLLSAAQEAETAYRDTAAWLRAVYAPDATPVDAVGADRYRRMARAWNGATLDLLATYEWGWAELDRITERMKEVGEQLLPGADSLTEVKAFMDASPEHTITGVDELLAFLEALTARATDAMDGTYFDIDPRVRTCEVRIAAEGSAAAPYYIPPAEDLSRPGSTWYPTLGKTVFPKWWLVSVWYHESVPGHHLQCSTVVLERNRLSRFQRTLGWTSGYGEGWALYAERLMEELGYFADPGEELGFLSAQALRAARVVVDIGLHLELTVPDGRGADSGRLIDHDLAVELMQRCALLDPAFAESEVARYLGLPGQAISYKVGERVWLEARAEAAERLGADFDLKAWHAESLHLGPLGLDPFREELARFTG